MKQDDLARALRRLVYTDRLLTMEQAYRYCDLAGIPRRALEDRPVPAHIPPRLHE